MIKTIKKLFSKKNKEEKKELTLEQKVISEAALHAKQKLAELKYSKDLKKNKDLAIKKNFQRTAKDDLDKNLPVFARDSAIAMDSSPQFPGNSFGANNANYSLAEFAFFAQQGFIGWQQSAILAQNAMINKACSLPGESAVRNGYEVTADEGEEIDLKVFERIRELDRNFKIKENLTRYEKFCLVFGIRIALFVVESDDPEYYLLPFNPDGITPGSYKGISQPDPYWCAPILNQEGYQDPASIDFYVPDFWQIGSKRYHKSHLVICKTKEVADILKPTYFYGGVPKTQEIFERLYQAERAANESTLLLFSKRLKYQNVDMDKAIENQADFEANMSIMDQLQTSFSTRFIGMEEEAKVFDISLADLDSVIMNQYQLFAAVAEIPSAYLFETEPKGFNTTGNLTIQHWRERQSDIQENDLQPVLDRHHLCLIRSEICPEFKIKPFKTNIKWNPLDEPTEKEQAEINKINSETDSVLINAGIVEQDEARDRLIKDKCSGYTGIKKDNPELEARNKIVNENPELEEEGEHEEFSRPSIY